MNNEIMASKYEISNKNGMRAVLTDWGASLVSLFVKDKDGNERDIVLGFDDVNSYINDRSYYGATVGRNCNRIAGASFELNGIKYQLQDNDGGNNLHSGDKGVGLRVWEFVEQKDDSIKFKIEDADLNEGFPGNAAMTVEYKLTDDNEIVINYTGLCDKDTVFNLTNHSYFNLNGQGSGRVFDQKLYINASYYTPLILGGGIPTGELAPVEGTPFDFRNFKKIGQDIEVENEQLANSHGYDHNYVVDKADGEIGIVAKAFSDESGITMEVFSDCPGVQFYTANYIGTKNAKGGASYEWRDAFCLETQYFPNAINEPDFKSPVTKAGETYKSTTIYKFGIK